MIWFPQRWSIGSWYRAPVFSVALSWGRFTRSNVRPRNLRGPTGKLGSPPLRHSPLRLRRQPRRRFVWKGQGLGLLLEGKGKLDATAMVLPARFELFASFNNIDRAVDPAATVFSNQGEGAGSSHDEASEGRQGCLGRDGKGRRHGSRVACAISTTHRRNWAGRVVALV